MQNDPNKVATTATGTPPPTTDSLLSTITERLMNSSGMVSSASTPLEKVIGDAVAGITKSNTDSKAAIESKYNREIDYAKSDQQNTLTANLESTRGFGVNIGALRALTDLTDKNIKDLESRKQELMLQGDAESVKQITDLQLKAYEYQADATQKTFNNLLSMGSLLLQEKNASKIPNADTSITEVGGRKLLIDNKTGATVKDLGAVPVSSSSGGGTEGERRQTTLNTVGKLFSAGHKIPSGTYKGIPFIDSDGYATPEGWKEAMKISGLPRKDFIEQFGYLIYNAGGKVSSKFGLTPQEIKLIASE